MKTSQLPWQQPAAPTATPMSVWDWAAANERRHRHHRAGLTVVRCHRRPAHEEDTLCKCIRKRVLGQAVKPPDPRRPRTPVGRVPVMQDAPIARLPATRNTGIPRRCGPVIWSLGRWASSRDDNVVRMRDIVARMLHARPVSSALSGLPVVRRSRVTTRVTGRWLPSLVAGRATGRGIGALTAELRRGSSSPVVGVGVSAASVRAVRRPHRWEANALPGRVQC